jgi:flagellar basal body L-ring protein FlgH
MKFLLIVQLLLLSSCASYVNSIHRQIDNEEKSKRGRYTRYKGPNDRRPIHNPVTLGGSPTANSRQNHPPGVQRNYQSPGKRRYRAEDLVDNQSDGSLWSGKNSESFLFVNNNLKKSGDIVIVEVMKQLKDVIQAELKRNFPDVKKATKPGTKKTEEVAEAAPAPAAAESPDKIYDKISTSVVEEVNQDYLLIRGRKEIMYKKFKRYFEVQAVVSQKDISSRDTVSSPKLLEPKINVLRY